MGQKILSIISFGMIKPEGASKSTPPSRKRSAPSTGKPSSRERGGSRPPTQRRRPDPSEVTTPRLHIGNLSYDTTEQDLEELFNGVGSVQDAEVVAHPRSHRSKGFAFVTMNTIDEARRAVEVLDDQAFMGRKLSVSGARSQRRAGRDRDDEKSSDADADSDKGDSQSNDEQEQKNAPAEQDSTSTPPPANDSGTEAEETAPAEDRN